MLGGTAADNRLLVDAVIYRYRAGLPRRDLSAHFGDWKALLGEIQPQAFLADKAYDR